MGKEGIYGHYPLREYNSLNAFKAELERNELIDVGNRNICSFDTFFHVYRCYGMKGNNLKINKSLIRPLGTR